MLIQLCVVFASNKEKKKKTLAVSPFIPLTLQIMLTKGSIYTYVITCINIFMQLQIDQMTNVTWPFCQNDKIDTLILQ